MQFIMWTNKILRMISILSALAFCLEVHSKPHFPFKNSDTVSQSGKLVVGKGTRLTLNKTEVNDDTSDGATDHLEVDHFDEPGSTAWYKVAQLKLQRLSPSVFCGNDAMTLRVHGSRLPNFMIDRGEGGLVPLTRMPAECGFSVRRVRRDVFIIAPYKGCHITQQGDSYVLPLRLWGAPVHMSCPITPHVPPTVTCFSSGMVAKISTISTDALQLKVYGTWVPLMSASSVCGFIIEAVTDGVAIAAPYLSSCWQVKDGEKLLYILGENGELTLSCHARDSNGYSDPHVVPTITTDTYTPTTNAPGSIASNHDVMYMTTPPTSSLLMATTRTTPSAYPAFKVPDGEHPPAHPFPPMYDQFDTVHLPFGQKHFHQPSDYGHQWGFTTGAPTPALNVPTAPVLKASITAPVTAPPVPSLHKTRGTTPSASVPMTVPTSIPTRNLQQSENPWMHYPFGTNSRHCKLCPYDHPCFFTEEPTTTTPAPTVPASDLKKPMYALPQVHYPSGYMLNHRGYPFYKYSYPWAPPHVHEADPSLTETDSDTISHKFQRPMYPIPQMYHFSPDQYIRYQAPWLYLYPHNHHVIS